MPSTMYIQYIMVPIKHILCSALPMDISSTKGMCIKNVEGNVCPTSIITYVSDNNTWTLFEILNEWPVPSYLGIPTSEFSVVQRPQNWSPPFPIWHQVGSWFSECQPRIQALAWMRQERHQSCRVAIGHWPMGPSFWLWCFVRWQIPQNPVI